MVEIKNFAFCFLSSESDDVKRQEKELKSLSKKYKIEKWFRHIRNANRYVSFSQMINDAIDDTNSEFMIFCNPKTYFVSEDIEFILDKLSNGYCFASIVSFGFFGFSKELIRNIGMLDERFLGGEYEDDDFAIRLALFGKSVWWDYDYSKYDMTLSNSPNLKHITHSIFRQKYIVNDENIKINKSFFHHKTISKRHIKNKTEIYDSWTSNNHGGGCVKYLNLLNKKNIEICDFNLNLENTSFEFDLLKNKSEITIEFKCEKQVCASIVFLKNYQNKRTILEILNIENEQVKTINLFDFFSQSQYDGDTEIRIFIDDNQIYNTIMEFRDRLNLKFKLPIFV